MSTENKPMTPQERIKADAEAAADLFDEQSKDSKDYDKRLQRVYGYINGYIAGATAEHDKAQGELKEAQDAARMFCNKHNETATQLAEVVDRSQGLVDALEAIKRTLNWIENTDELDIIRKALEQWKGKEVEDE